VAVIVASGAPRAQGYAQGRALRGDVRATIALWRRALGLRRWCEALRAARRDAGREIARFLPQEHERLQGLALAAGVPLAALVWLERSERLRLRAVASGSTLAAEPEHADDWIVRRSEPDAGGFASVELCAPALAGCVAGVSRAGVAVACAEDAPGLRLLAQDVLLRAPRLEAAIEHVRRRAPYLRQDGTLLAMDARRAPLELALRSGALELCEPSGGDTGGRALRLDAATPLLEWRGERHVPNG
jgi:hypothetical protein